MSDLAKRILKTGFIRKSALAVGLKVFGIVASYLFTLSITNLYGAAAWGQFSLAFVVLNVLSIVAVFGLNTALLKNVAQHASKGLRPVKRLYWQTLGFVGLLSIPLQLIMYFFSDLLAIYVFKDEQMSDPIKTMSFALTPFSILSVNTEVIRGLGRDVLFMLFTHVLRFFIPTVIVAIAYLTIEGQYAIESYLVGIVILFVLSMAINWSSLNKGEKTSTDAVPGFAILLSLGFPLLLANSSVFLKSWIDTFMIGVYMRPEDVGIYNVALKASLLVNLPLTAINAILAKNVASMHHQGKPQELELFVKRSTAVIIGLAYPLGFGLLLLRGPLLNMFGSEFENAMAVMVVLIVSALINVSAGSVGLVLQMTGGERTYRNILVSALLVSVLLNIFLIPRFGIMGAGISTCLTSLYWNGLSVIAVKRRLGFIPFPTDLKKLF